MLNAAQQMIQAWMSLPRSTVPLLRTMNYFGRTIPLPIAAVSPQPEGYPKIECDRIGNPYMVFRGSSIPYRHRPGRRERDGIGGLTVEKFFQGKTLLTRLDYAAAVKQHGSQRKAAAALGISLGKLQRELRK